MRAIKEQGYRRGSYFYHIKDGLHYHRNRILRNGRIYLRCVEFYHLRCGGKALMDPDRRNFRHTVVHNHRGNGHFVPMRDLRRSILFRCSIGDTAPQKDIVQEEGDGYSLRVRSEMMPTKLRSSMYRAKNAHLPRIPANLTTLALTLRDPAYRGICTTTNGQHRDFLYGGSCGKRVDRTRCVIFMTARMRNFLFVVKRVHCDATWDGRPSVPKSSQCFCIVTTIDHQMVPILVALMESKTRRCYDVLLAKIKHICPDFNPVELICDFEMGLMGSWTASFPGIDVYGCYYHCVDDMLKQAKKLQLGPVMRDNDMAERLVRCCCAIPLLPPQKLDEGFASIVSWSQEEGLYDVLGPFFLYVRDTWISKGAVLSVCGCEERTNNACESFHNVLQKKMGVRRPSMWRFIEGLKKIEDMAYLDLRVLLTGGTISRHRSTTSISNDTVITNLTRRLQEDSLDIRMFLRLASRRVQGVFNAVFPPPPPDQQ